MEVRVEKLTGRIAEVAALTGESPWQVKTKLRSGRYRAKKDGRMTKIIWSSVIADVNSLPDAKFAPPRLRTKTGGAS
jgi:hypothetical protein